MTITLDAVDRRLLAILQEDATVSVADLAERVGLFVIIFGISAIVYAVYWFFGPRNKF